MTEDELIEEFAEELAESAFESTRGYSACTKDQLYEYCFDMLSCFAKGLERVRRQKKMSGGKRR